MNARVFVLPAGVALGLALSATTNAAPAIISGMTAVVVATGQASSDAQRESDELLRQARKAIKDRDFEQAEKLIGQAEKLNVKYEWPLAQFKDTPAKLRKSLAEEKGKGGELKKPSSQFPALISREQKAAAAPPGNGQSPEQLMETMTNDGQAKAHLLLDQARKALQAGNVPDAMAAYQKVVALPAKFNPGEYSPASLAAELTAAGVDVARLAPAAGPASPYALPGTAPDKLAEAIPNLPSARSGGAFPGAIAAEAPAAQPELPSARQAPQGDSPAKREAQRLVAEARLALDQGDLAKAQALADQAAKAPVAETEWRQNETRPWMLSLEIGRAMSRREGVAPAAATTPAAGVPSAYPVARGVYNPANDNTRIAQVKSEPLPNPDPQTGTRLYDEGLKALEAGDRATALEKFVAAWPHRDTLDPAIRQNLKDKLTFLQAAVAPPVPLPRIDGQPAPLEEVAGKQNLIYQKLTREITSERKAAEELSQTDPRGAVANLQKLRERIQDAELDAAARKLLLTQVDRSISQLETYIEQNKATIDLKESNDRILSDIDRRRELKLETQTKLAQMVEQFNKLMDEKRYAEARVIAKQAKEIAPQETIVVNMEWKSNFAMSHEANKSIAADSERGFVNAMQSVDESSIPIDDRIPFAFGRADKWKQLSASRKAMLDRQKTRLSPVEQEIQKSLSKPVEARFDSRPLAEVVQTLGQMAGVNVHLDSQGLHSEGVTSDTPVTLNLTQPVSLRSALNLVLEQHRLSYVIENEVLKVTSEQTRNSHTYTKVYYVADLVTPIPNFTPSYHMGLPGALRESLNMMGVGGGMKPFGMSPLTVAQNDKPQQDTSISPVVLAQQMQQPSLADGKLPLPGARPNQPSGGGPGGLGGGVIADFDSLIDLITTTVAPQSWDTVGGPGAISEFATNLSLVISQTQDVHEQIADLLEQLRRLQDLQVTIEVRFITLSDNFFERIGVDFDFNIDDNSGFNVGQGPPQRQLQGGPPNLLFPDDQGPSIAVGLGPGGGFTPTLDFQFQNNSFGSTTPAFGGFDTNSVSTFGFAILSDIETFLVVAAAQGDARTNIMQAPKVTLFNGQNALVLDQSQRPFVTTVIPVVGDFAAAHMPVITVLPEGTSLSVQAVVSSDRRFVRLTLVPFFSQIGDVDTFTFVGRTTSDTGTVVPNPQNPGQPNRDNVTTTTEGTTVQLPTFSFTSVATTVSVPDGGTVLLGGIKRLREGRTERGVPLLSKLPYISRLFKNVGIGRDAQSLMMMVTPRIIIQEEEEENLGLGGIE